MREGHQDDWTVVQNLWVTHLQPKILLQNTLFWSIRHRQLWTEAQAPAEKGNTCGCCLVKHSFDALPRERYSTVLLSWRRSQIMYALTMNVILLVIKKVTSLRMLCEIMNGVTGSKSKFTEVLILITMLFRFTFFQYRPTSGSDAVYKCPQTLRNCAGYTQETHYTSAVWPLGWSQSYSANWQWNKLVLQSI